jgi:branched-chain amino acid transport system ATP-binding protein
MSALLSCAGLSRRFGGVLALDALSLEVPRESVLGLIGPNGSGKTTFFNVLTGLFAPSAGEVRFDGAAVTGLSPQRVYRLGIARTFQRSRLCLSLSVFDNLMVGNHRNLDHGFFVNLVARGRLARQVAASRARARELLRTFDERLSGCLDAPAGSIPMIDRRRV